MSEGECVHLFSFSEADLDDYDLGSDSDPEAAGWILTPDEPGVREATPADEVDDTYVWTCPHESVEGTDLDTCVFHTPTAALPAEKNASEELADRLEAASAYDSPTQRRRHLQFIDATFSDFDFRGSSIGGDMREYVDLRHAEIHNLDWELAEVVQRFRFSQATFHLDAAHPYGDEYEFEVDPSISFKQTDFRYDADFRGAEFHAPVRFHDAHFERWLGFKCVTCHHPMDFQMAQFDGLVSLYQTAFHDRVRANATTFENFVNGVGADFHGHLNCRTARFHDDVSLKQATLRAGARFDEATFDRSLFLTDGTLEGTLSLSDVDLTRALDAKRIAIDGTVELTHSRINRCHITPTTGGGYVTLRDSTVETGDLGQPEDGRIIYDFALATLGDIQLRGPPDETVDINGLCRFHRTTYDGFDFNDHDALDLEASVFAIHELAPAARAQVPASVDDPARTPTNLWATYLHAKNGATQVGDNTTAGRFFKAEMRHRAAEHAANATTASVGSRRWIANKSRYYRNRLLGVLAGYGEEPVTVVFWSFATILAFTLPFSVLLGIPTTVRTFLRYLALSFQSFVTFLLGEGPEGARVIVQLVSAFEGLLGAFFIALFVFTLTRRIRR